MADMTKVEAAARRMCRHTIVFTDELDILVGVRAMQGRTTKSIADELGLTESQVSYRIKKAQDSVKTKFRHDYRNGEGKLAKRMARASESIAVEFVQKQIAPQFIPLARQGVGRIQ